MSRKYLLSVAASLIIVSAIFIFPRGVAFAANHLHLQPQASCSGSACEGQDPVTTGCISGARVVKGGIAYRSHITNGTIIIDDEIDLWYSDACMTNYATVTNTNDRPYVERATDLRTFGPAPQIGGQQVFSLMAYAPSAPARACGFFTDGVCTPYI